MDEGEGNPRVPPGRYAVSLREGPENLDEPRHPYSNTGVPIGRNPRPPDVNRSGVLEQTSALGRGRGTVQSVRPFGITLYPGAFGVSCSTPFRLRLPYGPGL